MNTKKKVLSLGLLFLLASVGNIAKAYQVNVYNSTPFNVRYKVEYMACRDDLGELGPGEESFFRGTGGCLIRRVRAWVTQKAETEIYGIDRALDRKTVTAKPYYAPAGRGLDTNFIIAGPLFPFRESQKKKMKNYLKSSGGGDPYYYIVTRVVN